MIQPLSPNKAGLAFGALLGLFHLCWSILIALGWAQFIIDWIFKFHMIQPVYQVMPFSWSMMISLIIITSVFGYILGYVFGLLWNVLHK